MDSPVISNKRRFFEIFAVILTVIAKFIFMDYLNWRFTFAATAIISWIAYIIYRSKKERGVLEYWGFRTDNFRQVIRMILPWAIIAIVGFLAIGFYQKSLNISWHIMPILVLYPVWGVIQQFLLIGITAGNLQDMRDQKLSKTVIIVLCAILFGLVHYPYRWLAIATFVLAVFYGYVYLKNRNLYVLGLFHGWLGGIFYYTVLNRDPFFEMFGKFIT